MNRSWRADHGARRLPSRDFTRRAAKSWSSCQVGWLELGVCRRNGRRGARGRDLDLSRVEAEAMNAPSLAESTPWTDGSREEKSRAMASLDGFCEHGL